MKKKRKAKKARRADPTQEIEISLLLTAPGRNIAKEID